MKDYFSRKFYGMEIEICYLMLTHEMKMPKYQHKWLANKSIFESEKKINRKNIYSTSTNKYYNI